MAAYPAHVFEDTRPAELRQGAWLHDAGFLDALKSSWQKQYADYLGKELSEQYVQALQDEQRLYDHDEALTIHAWVDNRIVGVSALRPLRGIHLITMLEVLPDFRSKGIGEQLVSAHSCVAQCLMAHVSIHRPRAKWFYEQLGFTVLQRQTVPHDQHDLEFDTLACTCSNLKPRSI